MKNFIETLVITSHGKKKCKISVDKILFIAEDACGETFIGLAKNIFGKNKGLLVAESYSQVITKITKLSCANPFPEFAAEK